MPGAARASSARGGAAVVQSYQGSQAALSAWLADRLSDALALRHRRCGIGLGALACEGDRKGGTLGTRRPAVSLRGSVALLADARRACIAIAGGDRGNRPGLAHAELDAGSPLGVGPRARFGRGVPFRVGALFSDDRPVCARAAERVSQEGRYGEPALPDLACIAPDRGDASRDDPDLHRSGPASGASQRGGPGHRGGAQHAGSRGFRMGERLGRGRRSRRPSCPPRSSRPWSPAGASSRADATSATRSFAPAGCRLRIRRRACRSPDS